MCVVFALFTIMGGCARVDISSRMAVEQRKREGKSLSEEFREGATYTIAFTRSALPTFLFSSAALAVLALLPFKAKSSNEDDN